MRHLREEELIEHYYATRAAGRGEDAGREKEFRAAEGHLQACGACAEARAALAAEMGEMDGLPCAEADAAYGTSVWNRVASRLPRMAAEEPPRRRAAWGMMLGWAAASAVLVIGAFEVGRVWEHRQHAQTAVARPAPPVERQIVVVVLGDHLDRTERLLVELKHAQGEDPDVVKPMRDEARSLLAANRVFREDADKSGDKALIQALDHLNQLLNDVANAPGGLNAASIARLQREMEAEGLLFKVRVLRSRNAHQGLTARIVVKGGTV
ncbi:hypothetical protein DYQ86_17120 [Acidobacteria bacterium AB60]|nr:hypothetical protein DYQ86_17120 [Acidobacteria bacterium AB60]